MKLSLYLQPLIFGLVLIATPILAFLTYTNNKKSATNKLFAFLAIVTELWVVLIYISSRPYLISYYLPLARFTILFAPLQALAFFLLAKTIPSEKIKLKPKSLAGLVFSTGVVMFLTVSPWIFSSVKITNNKAEIVPGPAMPVFVLFVSFLSISAVVFLIKNILSEKNEVERKQMLFVLFGVLLMLGLIIATIMIPVVFFKNDTYLPFAPVYVFLFLLMVAIAILRYHLFNLKVIATEALTFVLWTVLFAKIFSVGSGAQKITDVLVFGLSFVFGILLIKSVLKEVKQRERLEVLTEELQRANDKLAELNRLKSEFLSFASHQVKSPMTVVKGYASLIADGSYGEASSKVKETAQKIVVSADKMIALVNNLLDLRKIEEGKMAYNFESVSLTNAVKTTAEELKPLADRKNLNFSFASSIAPQVKANLDTQKFSQVIQNLIDNAIKYTDAGFVKITLDYNDSDRKTAVIKISDSGRGISADLLPRLFKAFIRDAETAKSIQGTGLGLYIAKEIITAHGGEISAESGGDGKGSVFTITIPVLENSALTRGILTNGK